MAASLTKSVLAGGRVFPAGTVREGEAAKVIPSGDWWSDSDDAPTGDESFDPSGHNQDEVIAHLDEADEDERARVLTAESSREGGSRQKIAKWAESREAQQDDAPTGDES